LRSFHPAPVRRAISSEKAGSWPNHEHVAAARRERRRVEVAAGELLGELGLDSERLAGEARRVAARTFGLVRQASISSPRAASARPAARAPGAPPWRSVVGRVVSVSLLGVTVAEEVDHA